MSERQRPLMNRLAATAASAALLLAAGPAHAQVAHGAIAFSHSEKGQNAAYGFAWNYATQDEAEASALNACVEGGGADCALLAWVRNGCSALAMDRYGRAEGKSAMSEERAEARAMRACEAGGGDGCGIVGSLCARPGGEAGTWSGSDKVLAVSERRMAVRQQNPRDEGLTREHRIRVQRGLAALGFEAGPADGMFGPRTRSAIWEWQQAKGLEATGYLTRDQAEVLAAADGEVQRQPASQQAARPDPSGNQVLYLPDLGTKCAELEGHYTGDNHGECWQEVRSQPGCHVWNDHYHSDMTVDWTGACVGSVARGPGSFSSSGVDEYHDMEATGAYRDGKKQGRWVVRFADGAVGQGPYLDGKRHGQWIWRYHDGGVSEGPYLDGKRHGQWVWRYADGAVHEGPYVDGKRHGRWVERYANGNVFEIDYVDGKRNGQPGVYIEKDGVRYPGRFSDDGKCFRDREGRLRAWWGERDNCQSR